MFAGEVKPRHEADLGFPHRRQDHRALRGCRRRACKQGTAARAPRPGRRRPAGRSRQGASGRDTRPNTKFAQAEYERYQGLLKEKFISASALDAKRNAMNANRAKFEQAKANLAVAQNQASYATLVATDDGVITAVNAEAGQVVTAGQAVMRLAREDEREVAIACRKSRIGELTRRQADRCHAGRQSAQAVSGERAGNRAGCRRDDAHVRRSRRDR